MDVALSAPMGDRATLNLKHSLFHILIKKIYSMVYRTTVRWGCGGGGTAGQWTERTALSAGMRPVTSHEGLLSFMPIEMY